MAKLTDDQVVEVIDTINLFDKKGDGKFPTDSMINILRSLGLNPLQSEVEKITKDIKEYEKQSRVDVEDFLPIYEYFLKKKKPTFQDLCDGLKSLNPSQAEEGGTIAAVDLRIAMTTIGDNLTRGECDSILDKVTDKYNEVNVEQLVRLVMGDDEAERDPYGSPRSTYVATAMVQQQQQQEQGSKAVRQILG